MASTALYRAVIVEVRRQIALRGWTMEKCDTKSGVADGYTAKALHPDTPSGRQSRWETLQDLIDALFPGGVHVTIREKILPDASIAGALRQGDPEGARRMAVMRVLKQSPAHRRRIAKRAIRERWRRNREGGKDKTT